MVPPSRLFNLLIGQPALPLNDGQRGIMLIRFFLTAEFCVQSRVPNPHP